MTKYIPGHNGKMAYYRRKEAVWVMRNANHGVRLRMYKCFLGERHHWHLTSMSKSDFKMGRKARKNPSEAFDFKKKRPMGNHEI